MHKNKKIVTINIKGGILYAEFNGISKHYSPQVTIVCHQMCNLVKLILITDEPRQKPQCTMGTACI